MKEPHLLLASANSRQLKGNLSYFLDQTALDAIEQEIIRNVKGLFELGLEHYNFAKSLDDQTQWRQLISRMYYAAYNVRRSIWLAYNGNYSTDSSDHQKVGLLPDSFPEKIVYSSQLKLLRDDRNLCDYDHTVTASQLAINCQVSKKLVADFIHDAQTFLQGRGISI